MVQFLPWNSSTNPIINLTEWNQQLASGHEKLASYIIRKNSSYYESIKSFSASLSGNVIHGGEDDAGGIDGTDAGQVINAAITAISNTGVGGKLFIKNGQYDCGTAITGANAVDIEGESMGPWEDFDKGVVLYYTGGVVDAFVDYINCRSFNFSNFKVWGGADPGTPGTDGNAVAGIRLGGTGAEGAPHAGRTKCCNFTNVTWGNFDVGLLGGTFTAPATYAGHGPDDSVFINCYGGFSDVAAVANLSSQTSFYGGTFHTSLVGVSHRAVTTHSPDSAMQFYRTVWSGCDTCVEIVDVGNIRGMAFFGTWMEDCDTTLLDLTNATGSYCGDFTFYNCMGYPNAGATSLFSLTGKSCRILWDGGELYPNDAAETILTGDGGVGAVQILRIRPLSGVERYTCSDLTSVRGQDKLYLQLIHDTAGFNTGCVAAAWASATTDQHVIWTQYEPTKITVHYYWDPNSASGQIRLAYPAGTAITGSIVNPGAAGVREDVQDITDGANGARKLNYLGHLVTECYGDGANAPILYKVYLTIEI
jgi:hypothetical protein